MCNVLLNGELNGVELYFESKPTIEVLKNIKESGYRWNSRKKCWYSKQNEESLKVASSLSDNGITGAVEEKATSGVKKNNIDLWALTQLEAVTRPVNYNNKEIAKELRSYLKKRFPFVKFSIRTRGKSIDCDIMSAPFEEGSIYLEAIAEYCRKYTDTYNYDNSDAMTDYFDVNFYGGYFQTSYDYVQTEATAEIEEAKKNFDLKVVEAEEQKRIDEEKAYKEYLKQCELEKIEENARQKRVAEEKIYICNNVEVVELEKEYFIVDAQFANLNKNNTLAQYKEEVEKGDFYNNTLKVTRELHFKDMQALEYFQNMLLHDFDFINGTGGSYTEDVRINSMTDYYNMTKEDKDSVQWLLSGIAVYYESKLQFVIDAQGYCYARYIGLIGGNTEIKDTIKYEQVLSVEEVEQLEVEAQEITELYNTIVEKNSFDYNYRKAVADAIRKNCLLSLDNGVVQQIKDEDIKKNLYKVLKEVDTIEDQIINDNFIAGKKFTIVKLSAIGGAGISHVTFERFDTSEKKNNIIVGVKGKKGLYSMTLKDEILMYADWVEVPASVLYRDTSNKYFTGSETLFGSYDKNALGTIMDHLQEKNILPILNTYKPIF